MGIKSKEKREGRRAFDEVLQTVVGIQFPETDQGALRFVTEFVFGNIALRGASNLTEWEDGYIGTASYVPNQMNFHVPRNLISEFPGEANVNLRDSAVTFQINMRRIVTALQAVVKTSTNAFVRNKPFRRLCCAYANEAMIYLAARKVDGEYSNLVEKMPLDLAAHPEVAFDFNDGLDIMTLSSSQRSVMQKMRRRLFATEIKKKVVEAQSDH